MACDTYGQWNGVDAIIYPPGEAEKLNSEYKRNQPVHTIVTRQGKAVGKVVEQSNLLHACFAMVTENSDNPNHHTLEATKMSCKIDIDFRDPRFCFVRPDKGVQLAYRSFKITGPGALKGAERDVIVQKALSWCADVLGMTVADMVAKAQDKMRRW